MKSINWGGISTYRNALMGIAALWIILFHGIHTGRLNGVILNIAELGNTGVDIFLILSGVGMYFSFMKNTDISKFYKKRLITILPLYIVVIVIYSVVIHIFSGNSIFHTLLHSIYISSSINPGWYIPFAIFMYFIYPLIHNIMFHNQTKINVLTKTIITVALLILLCFAMNSDIQNVYNFFEAGLTRIPIFIIGCYLRKNSI